MDIQTDNPTDDIGIQTDEIYRRRNAQREDDGDEQDTGGGRGNLASRMASSVSTGARHIRPIAQVVGVVGGGIAVAGGYVAGAAANMGLQGLRSAGEVVMNAMRGSAEPDDEDDGRPTQDPLSVGGGSSSSTAIGEARPSYLLDRRDDVSEPRRGPTLGATASRYSDKKRLERYKAEDEAKQAEYDINFKKGVAEATLRQHGIR
jgi:hypothetical protein